MIRAVIIDYGSGNLRSATKAFERAARDNDIDADVLLTGDAKDLAGATHIVLPGVGAFADCKAGLLAVPGMAHALRQAVEIDKKPFLGICVGMQLMAERGLEHGVHTGFGWIPGDVVKIEPSDPGLKIPHMGWNALTLLQPDHPVLAGLADGDHVYFVHSYGLVATDRSTVLAETGYGGHLTAAVGRDNMAGTQFHPEKSQRAGLRLIANFLRWRP
jgi:glutamine amidotransferase